jgi:nucleoside-diphosphate-sugar epimerase
MRVFVAGATGAIGAPLVTQLVEAGHEVVGTTRTPEKAERLRGLGAEPVVLDLLDRDAVLAAVRDARPDAIAHEATALTDIDLKRFAESFAQTNRLRTDGTDTLLAAARESGVERFVAQSFAAWSYAREGGPVKSEADAPDPDPPELVRETVAAIRHVEEATVAFGGAALRYGWFYGAPGDPFPETLRARKLPIVGGGEGVWSFVHVEDAAAATVLALERGAHGVFNVADDEPAPVRELLPELATLLGAAPPRKVPAWLGRIFAGEVAVIAMTEIRGVSSEKAKRELAWKLRYPSWRDGFAADQAAARAA